MNAANPMPLIYNGRAGDYYGTKYAELPSNKYPSIDAADRLLISQGLSYCGKLACSQFPQVAVYGYTTADRKVSVSLMETKSLLGGIDCISRFTDDSFLTTTTVRVVPGAYDKQRLFRFSFPTLNALELLAQHLAYIEDFENRCGTAQALYGDLLSIAHSIDEYNLRQKSNNGHGFITYAGGFAQLITKAFRDR